MTEESLFFAALERCTPAERAYYLDVACEGDAVLRREVEALLQAHEQDALCRAPTLVVSPPDEHDGMVIGPYKLRERIGEGGMGTVYVAEQERPVRRRVALKIVKEGMDTHQVVARFEAERQALALMDHPYIAKVLDAGATDSGRPYFVMELVRGMPITEYCRRMRLPTRDRLTLFVDVCHAVQHAHQKGIIHRDLKPSNVLVGAVDGKPVPKVIDFGIAKATGQRLTCPGSA
jgi:eukaryotic-like serine/threonine-protein kinase